MHTLSSAGGISEGLVKIGSQLPFMAGRNSEGEHLISLALTEYSQI